MNKVLRRKILSIFSILIFTCTSIGVYGYTNYSNDELNSKKEAVGVEIAKAVPTDTIEESTEEIVEQDIEKVIEEEPVFESTIENVSYSNDSGNHIQISDILYKDLMKDEVGDNFYLNHNIYGTYDGLGVPYIDFRTDFTTRKTIVYAHSSTLGNGPFQVLQNYHNNKSFYDSNPYVTVTYNGNTYTYQIFSVYVSTADSEESDGLEYFHIMNYSDAAWELEIQQYKNNSEYDTGVSVSGSDKILILQTCSMDPNYYEQYYRYNLLVMGKLI